MTMCPAASTPSLSCSSPPQPGRSITSWLRRSVLRTRARIWPAAKHVASAYQMPPIPATTQPASITSATEAALRYHEWATAGSFTVTTAGVPAPTVTESGALPAGVTFNSTTGILSGTPAAGTQGNYAITFTAHNGIGTDATQNFTLVVNPAATQAASITSASSATFTVGTAGSFTVTTAGLPAPTVTQTGTLPCGVTFNSATGILGGTPAAGTQGSYPITFTAHNGVGTDATQNFTLIVNAAAGLSSSPSSVTVAAGSSATYTITNTSNVSLALSCTGLPTGAACTPVTVPANSSASLVITSMSRTAAVTPGSRPNNPFHLDQRIEMLSLLGMLTITIVVASKRRRILALAPIGVLATLLIFVAAGCGSAGTASVNPNGTLREPIR